MKNFAILLLVVVVAWFASAIIRLENQRYALELGICGIDDREHPDTFRKRAECLAEVRARTNPAYNLLYGLNIL